MRKQEVLLNYVGTPRWVLMGKTLLKYYKIGQLCVIAKWDKGYYKVGQVLRSEATLWQIEVGITKWGTYQNLGQYQSVNMYLSWSLCHEIK